MGSKGRRCLSKSTDHSPYSSSREAAPENGGGTADLVFPPNAFRSIRVSPIGIGFFSGRGLQVMGSDLCWVGLPSLALVLGLLGWRLLRRRAGD